MSLDKDAILLLTNKESQVVISQYEAIRKAIPEKADVFIAFHFNNGIPGRFKNVNLFRFNNSILSELGYKALGNTLVPGNNHFPLFKFYLEYQAYENYWIIEDDVRFNGSWSSFFNTFFDFKSDFTSCQIRHWNEDPNWYWWNSLKHPSKTMLPEKRLASFNPIYRISKKALEFLDRCLKDNWQGHHEVLFPSLLNDGGYQLADFGGSGKYVLPGFENKFYLNYNGQINDIPTEGTMRFRPSFGFTGHYKNKLYHPVKNFDEKTDQFHQTTDLRWQWINQMDLISRPVIKNLAQDKLKACMPVDLSKRIDNSAYRSKAAHLEGFARTLSGIAPWINSECGDNDEKALRQNYREWVIKAITNAVNPQSKDYLVWHGGQALVDASYFALALIRAPWIWENLDNKTRKNLVNSFWNTKNTIPVYTNWILFPAMIESFFCRFGLSYDMLRIEYGVREFMEHWYIGDGMFSDGHHFHMDAYNSIVIQPFLSTILDVINSKTGRYLGYKKEFDKICHRYAQIQEKMIAPDGTFQIIGRSATYRTGHFHHLADMAFKKRLPKTLSPAQVREGLNAAIKKTLQPKNTINKTGWLNIGVSGHQPDLADFYITTGSLYMCMNVFLPLGLPNSDSFWQLPYEPWSSVKIWTGEDIASDYALDI